VPVCAPGGRRSDERSRPSAEIFSRCRARRLRGRVTLGYVAGVYVGYAWASVGSRLGGGRQLEIVQKVPVSVVLIPAEVVVTFQVSPVVTRTDPVAENWAMTSPPA
jgi:hypothetical protein